MQPPAIHVCALSAYSIKRKGGKFYVARVNHDNWAGPYDTLHDATTAIARLRGREWHDRHKNICQHHGWEE